jgi:hypothetical protein
LKEIKDINEVFVDFYKYIESLRNIAGEIGRFIDKEKKNDAVEMQKDISRITAFYEMMKNADIRKTIMCKLEPLENMDLHKRIFGKLFGDKGLHFKRPVRTTLCRRGAPCHQTAKEYEKCPDAFTCPDHA